MKILRSKKYVGSDLELSYLVNIFVKLIIRSDIQSFSQNMKGERKRNIIYKDEHFIDSQNYIESLFSKRVRYSIFISLLYWSSGTKFSHNKCIQRNTGNSVLQLFHTLWFIFVTVNKSTVVKSKDRTGHSVVICDQFISKKMFQIDMIVLCVQNPVYLT